MFCGFVFVSDNIVLKIEALRMKNSQKQTRSGSTFLEKGNLGVSRSKIYFVSDTSGSTKGGCGPTTRCCDD